MCASVGCFAIGNVAQNIPLRAANARNLFVFEELISMATSPLGFRTLSRWLVLPAAVLTLCLTSVWAADAKPDDKADDKGAEKVAAKENPKAEATGDSSSSAS